MDRSSCGFWGLVWLCALLACFEATLLMHGNKAGDPIDFFLVGGCAFFCLSLITAYLLGARSRWIYIAVLSGLVER